MREVSQEAKVHHSHILNDIWTMTALVEITIVAAPRILGVAATIALLITFLNLIRRLCSTASLPSILPWAGIGEHNNRLGRAKANLASVFHLRRLLDEGYEKVSLASAVKNSLTPSPLPLRNAT